MYLNRLSARTLIVENSQTKLTQGQTSVNCMQVMLTESLIVFRSEYFYFSRYYVSRLMFICSTYDLKNGSFLIWIKSSTCTTYMIKDKKHSLTNLNMHLNSRNYIASKMQVNIITTFLSQFSAAETTKMFAALWQNLCRAVVGRSSTLKAISRE